MCFLPLVWIGDGAEVSEQERMAYGKSAEYRKRMEGGAEARG